MVTPKEVYEELLRAPHIYLAIFLLVFLAGLVLIDDEKATSEVALSKAVVPVDEDAWHKTLGTIEDAYSRACNRAVARFYEGDQDTGFDRYICKPVRGAVVIKLDGRMLGMEPVEFPWRNK